jgi:hypothetical protein
VAFEIEENSPYEHAANIGFAFLSVVWAANQLGHVTLRGHLVYQNENQYEQENDFYRADVVKWMRYMSAWGKENRNEIEYPEGLLELARLLGIGQLSEKQVQRAF